MRYHEECCYSGYSVQADNGNPSRTDILDAIIERIEYMIKRFGRVLFVRFDLRYPQGCDSPKTNQDLSRLLNSFGMYLTRGKIAFQYVWAREQSLGMNQHYHVMMLLNGNVTRNSIGHLAKAGELWQSAIGVQSSGLLHRCSPLFDGNNSCQVMLDRNDHHYEENIRECVHWASYLAKVYSKGNAPYRGREWGATSIR